MTRIHMSVSAASAFGSSLSLVVQDQTFEEAPAESCASEGLTSALLAAKLACPKLRRLHILFDMRQEPNWRTHPGQILASLSALTHLTLEHWEIDQSGSTLELEALTGLKSLKAIPHPSRTTHVCSPMSHALSDLCHTLERHTKSSVPTSRSTFE